MVVVCICSSMFPMLNFERSGTETTDPVFGVGFCACSMFALPITMLSSAITRRVCFIVVFSWEGAHSPPSLIQTPPAALSFRQTLARERTGYQREAAADRRRRGAGNRSRPHHFLFLTGPLFCGQRNSGRHFRQKSESS